MRTMTMTSTSAQGHAREARCHGRMLSRAEPATTSGFSRAERKQGVRIRWTGQGRWSRRRRRLSASDATSTAATSKVKLMFERLRERSEGLGNGSGGAGSTATYESLQRADAVWDGIKSGRMRADVAKQTEQEKFVSTVSGPCPSSSTANSPPRYDAVVSGGTLGIIAATVLQRRGYRVAVVERGRLKGREQDWNISRAELGVLERFGVLTLDELEKVIVAEWNPVRVKFHGSEPIFVNDVLNVGVSPALLVDTVRGRFEALGGTVLELYNLDSVDVFDDGVLVHCSSGESGTKMLRARLLIDCMGFTSPIVRQIRGAERLASPDGVCLVVGTCASGFDPERNTSSDLIVSIDDQQQLGGSAIQLFWEAFPASGGGSERSTSYRTTYMFAYLNPAEPSLPSLESMFEAYLENMPRYQQIGDGDSSALGVEVIRPLFGFFPTYRGSPLESPIDRILQIGDASGIQSPLSFGGFGALLRHLPRITAGICDGLENDILDCSYLNAINAYHPSLSAAWLFQRAMSCSSPVDAPPSVGDRAFVNRLLGLTFDAMRELGDDVMLPFLQDVTQFGGLSKTLVLTMAKSPAFVPVILLKLGPLPIIEWVGHFVLLGFYSALTTIAGDYEIGANGHRKGPVDLSRSTSSSAPRDIIMSRRRREAWKYGSGLDHGD